MEIEKDIGCSTIRLRSIADQETGRQTLELSFKESQDKHYDHFNWTLTEPLLLELTQFFLSARRTFCQSKRKLSEFISDESIEVV